VSWPCFAAALAAGFCIGAVATFLLTIRSLGK
jgi:hypothetical protein